MPFWAGQSAAALHAGRAVDRERQPSHSVTPEGARRAGVFVLAAVIVVALASCAGQLKPVALPSKSPTPTGAATPAVAATPAATATPSSLDQQKAQVMQADMGYTIAITEAQESDNASAARDFLGPYVTSDSLNNAVSAMAAAWSQGTRFSGEDVPYVQNITIQGGTVALVQECDDLSSSRLTYANGKVVTQKFQNLINTLKLVGGRWIVDGQKDVDGGPCGG